MPVQTYTLDQLVFFTETDMERVAMSRAMRALGVDEDACFALGSSDSTGDRNCSTAVPRLCAKYEQQLKRYIDSVVAVQAAA